MFDDLAREVFRVHQDHPSDFPSRQRVHRFADELLELLFPQLAAGEEYLTVAEVRAALAVLSGRLRRLLGSLATRLPRGEDGTVEAFFAALPAIYERLWLDVRAIEEGDPAAEGREEVVAAYPGFLAIATYRLAHELYRLEVPLLPRILTEYAHLRTGVDIHPGARIGRSFCIDHGTGVVIGETAVIGDDVKIYQGVSLGALSVSKELAGTKRHPTIEDRVVIYSSATILGGRTVIGHDSVIGGNVWLTDSVPPYSVVYHRSEVRIRSKETEPDVIDFSI